MSSTKKRPSDMTPHSALTPPPPPAIPSRTTAVCRRSRRGLIDSPINPTNTLYHPGGVSEPTRHPLWGPPSECGPCRLPSLHVCWHPAVWRVWLGRSLYPGAALSSHLSPRETTQQTLPPCFASHFLPVHLYRPPFQQKRPPYQLLPVTMFPSWPFLHIATPSFHPPVSIPNFEPPFRPTRKRFRRGPGRRIYTHIRYLYICGQLGGDDDNRD